MNSPMLRALIHGQRIEAALAEHPAALRLDDLPEGILLHDLAVAEGVEVAAAHFQSRSRGRGAGQGPLRDAHVAVDVMDIVAVVHIRQALEASLQGFANGPGTL